MKSIKIFFILKGLIALIIHFYYFTDNKDEIGMLIAGNMGVGKSSLANSIAGKRMQESKWNMKHVTVTLNSAKLTCKRQEMSLIYFDTPGLSSDVKTAQNEYWKCLITDPPGLHAILIVQKATEYTSSNQAFLDTCTKIFGENCWKYIIFVFTHIDELKRDLKDQIEDADESLKRYLSKCGNRYVEINNNLKGTKNDQQINALLSAVKDLMKTNNGEIYTKVEFKENYKRMQNAARDGNLTSSEECEKNLNTMASKKVITGVCKGFIKECFNMHV